MAFQIPAPCPSSSSRPIRLLQLSDAHLLKDTSKSFAGINPYGSLQAVLEYSKRHAPFDCILSTGDIAQEPDPVTYQHYFTAINSLSVPHFWVRGNHDSTADFPDQLECGRPSVILVGQWCIIMLNSQTDGHIYGMISDFQLQCLKEELSSYADYFTVLAFHHNSFLVGCEWLDQHNLKNTDALLEAIAPHPQVKAVISGHVHQEYVQKEQGVYFFSSPSTCIQFKPNSEHFTLDPLNAGYRILELFPDGECQTQVVRIDQQIGQLDNQLKCY